MSMDTNNHSSVDLTNDNLSRNLGDFLKDSIVKYDRRFCEFRGFNSLSKVDQDLFYSLLSILRERKEVNTVVASKDLMMRSKYLGKNQRYFSKAKLYNAIDQMVQDVLPCSMLIKNGETKEYLNIFERFNLNEKTLELTVSLAPTFSNLFFNITEMKFTRFYLDNFLGLKSKYSKSLYRLLLDHHTSFTIDIDDLYGLFKITSSSSKRMLLHRLPKYIKEIQDSTDDFSDDPPIQFTVNHSGGFNRPVESVTFIFKEKLNRITEALWSDRLPLCPYCGKSLKWSVNSKTGESFIGHVDYTNSTCRVRSFPTLESLVEAVESEQRKKKYEMKKEKEQAERTSAVFNKTGYAHGFEIPDFKNIHAKSAGEVDLPKIEDAIKGDNSKM